MKKFLIIAAFITLAGCQTTGSGYSEGTNSEQRTQPPSTFANFTDISVPTNAVMNLDKTVIMGSGEEWTGKLAFNAPYSPNQTFDFFVEEMPKFGWSETTIVRANTSFMTYSRNGREMIIQIYGDGDESYVDLMVSPQKKHKK